MKHLLESATTAGAAWAVILTAQTWRQRRGTEHERDAAENLATAIDRLNEQSLKLKKRLAKQRNEPELNPLEFISRLLGG